jgi:uncharacterized FlaG/YvyC family protein
MEIKTHTPPAPIPSVSTAKPGEERDNVPAHRRVQPSDEAKADNKTRSHRQRAETPKPPPPKVSGVRLELRIDDATNQVFGRVIDRDTGEEVRQIPAEGIRHLQAISRELFDALVDETV